MTRTPPPAHRRARTALVLATALLAGIAPVALGGSAAVAAPPLTAGPAAPAAPAGTVVQQGGPLIVPSGTEGPVTTRVTVTQETATTGQLKARLIVPWFEWNLPGESRFDLHVTPSCAVNGGAFQSCSWDTVGGARLPATAAAKTVTYDIRIDAGFYASHLDEFPVTLEVTAEDGTVVASGPVTFQFHPGTPEPEIRTTILARDKSGDLWQYENTGRGDKPLSARKRVGWGWDVYTSITSLNYRTATGRGDVVARDKQGVLWIHRGSGDPKSPFKPRERVGGGWNQYDAIFAVAGNLDARDKDGNLWRYYTHRSDPETGATPAKPFSDRRKVGFSWHIYNLIAGDHSGYSTVARDKSGVLWSYNYDTYGYNPRVRKGGGWNAYDSILWARDFHGADRSNLVARDKQGRLWIKHPGGGSQQLGWGWDIYNAIF
ncbi:hypothetical protein AB0G74_04240 [Streptomyces sp. NPDC020875]|uniref:hypothetical protein n=1 Tax=Streptomyces sp. NPDC020875 TaxID=3154898 RepID=UPI0033EB16C5